MKTIMTILEFHGGLHCTEWSNGYLSTGDVADFLSFEEFEVDGLGLVAAQRWIISSWKTTPKMQMRCR